jgi:hypothetical protein
MSFSNVLHRVLRLHIGGFLVLAAMLVGIFGCVPAKATVSAPGWSVDSLATPTNFSAKDSSQCISELENQSARLTITGCDVYEVYVTNSGHSATNGSAMTIADSLPAGVTLRALSLFWSAASGLDLNDQQYEGAFCKTSPIRCELPFTIGPDETFRMLLFVTVDNPGESREITNTVNVSGGGASSTTSSAVNRIGDSVPSFGMSNFNFFIDGIDGEEDNVAGDHPYEVTTTIDLNNMYRTTPEGTEKKTSSQDLKDVVVDLPVGFAGSTLAAPECTMAQLSGGECPKDTIIGHLLTEPETPTQINSPIWNLVPEHGFPAEFGYVDLLKGSHVFYVQVVPSPKGYVLQVTNPEIPQISLKHIVATFYGDPAEHDDTGNASVPFFTDPTSCSSGPLVTSVHIDSWQKPGSYNKDGTPNFSDPSWVSATSEAPPPTGCNLLQFPAEIAAQPTTHEADKPSGMNFDMRLPQTEKMGIPATPALDKAVVTLPEGFTVDPAAGDGLAACSIAQIGWLGGTVKNFSPAAPECPEASKIGSLELETPLIPRKLEGIMYLARQNENPFGATLGAYVVVDDPITGVLIKIAGEFLPDPHTGRLTAVFDENPQLPFSDLQLHFFGGPRAELATPEQCGTYRVSTELTPWSLSFPELESPAAPFEDFVINEACPSGFNPSFTAGSSNLQAGAYTPFIASFSRSDTDQELAGLSVSLPPGLLANLSDVTLCTDTEIQEAREGKQGCPASSQVGSVLAGAGPGPNPLFVHGKAYLTGPYSGGPYGLAAVVPAVAGPFNFGTVVVRQSIRIDPLTAQVTDVSDPFPTIIDGIPLRLRRVDVRLERPGFMLNPTNCSHEQFSGTITGTPLGAPTVLQGDVGFAAQAGASSGFSTPFQVTNCATLGFKPGFKVSTSAKTSRKNGASLNVKLSYPKGSLGKQADVKSVKVDLPKQLPSNLKTLQKACVAKVFDADPGSCPAGSEIGTATAATPILAKPLMGPAYFVSYGAAKFPELVIVLQGENGLAVQLHGETFINPKTNITSSTFHAIPDVPVETFTLSLPEGSNSALDANTNLCTVKGGLHMPTQFVAQNGMVLKQSTLITISGCAKHKTKKKTSKHNKKGKHGK